MPLAVTVGTVWSPPAAALTVANRGDHEGAPWLVKQLPADVRDVWSDIHDTAPVLRDQCHQRGCELVATRPGPSLHGDGGVGGRTVFQKLRSQAIEPCNGLYKTVFEWRVKMPVKGLQRSQLLALCGGRVSSGVALSA